MKVFVKRYVQQITDGTHYKGHITIGVTKYFYDLKLLVPISVFKQLNLRNQIQDYQDIRLFFQVAVSRDGVDLDLDHNEHYIFFHFLLFAIAGFCENEKVCEMNALKKKIDAGLITDPKVLKTVNDFVFAGRSDKECEIDSRFESVMTGPNLNCILKE